MMACFGVVFFGVLVLVAMGVIWAGWSVVAMFVARRQPAAAILLGLPASVVIVGAAVAGCWAHGNRPGTIFAREFGFAPPADVVFVNGEHFALGDSGSAHLQFSASPATIARCVAGAGLATSPPPMWSTNATPAWFVPPPTASDVYVRSTPLRGGGFSSEMRILRHDPATDMTWFEFFGVD